VVFYFPEKLPEKVPDPKLAGNLPEKVIDLLFLLFYTVLGR
jgi:hypothetical protein